MRGTRVPRQHRLVAGPVVVARRDLLGLLLPDEAHVGLRDRRGAVADHAGLVDVLALLGEPRIDDEGRIVTLYPYGEGLAALYIPDGASLSETVLRPVEMTTGALLPAVATDVLAARRMQDGRIALALGDVPTGRLAVTPDGAGGVRYVTDLPRIAERVADVGLSGDTVAAFAAHIAEAANAFRAIRSSCATKT